MDNDIGERLEQFLSRPDSMEKIQAMMASLSGAAASDTGAETTPPSAPTGGGVDLAAIQKWLPLLQGGGDADSDPHVALLRALRPYLHDGREKRVDEAIEMMRLAKLLPLFKNKS